MIRKWMTLLLSLLLAVAVPMSAMADTQHTFTVVPGELLASEQAVADLLNAMDLRITEGDRSGALTVMLNDKALVTVGLTADSTGLYAASEVLGEDVLYITWEDGFAMLTDLMKASLEAQGIDDPTAVQAIESTLAETKNSIVAAVGSGAFATPQTYASISVEESLALVEEIFPNDAKMLEYAKGIYENMTIEDGSFADENRDTADQKYSLTTTAEDMQPLYETEYMNTLLREALLAGNAEATQEELDEAVALMIEESKKVLEESGFAMQMDMYTLDAGQTLVGMDATSGMTLDVSETEGVEELLAMEMTINYDRLTGTDGVAYKADAAIAVDGEKMEVAFDLNRANSGVSEGMLGMLLDGAEFVITYRAENTAADTRERTIALYTRSGATAILKPAASDSAVIGFEIKTEPAPAETLAKLESATPDNSVNVLTLSDTEMESLITAISTNAMQVLYTALGELPTSVLSMLMSE